MDLTKVQVGMKIYGYKSLCETLNIPVKTGANTVNNQINRLKSFLDFSIDKLSHKRLVYTINKIYDEPIEIEKKTNYKNYENYKVDEDFDKKMGVYAVKYENYIYIGSAKTSLRHSFLQLRKNPNTSNKLREMLKNGTYEALYVAEDGATKEDVDKKNFEFFTEYKNNPNWNLVRFYFGERIIVE